MSDSAGGQKIGGTIGGVGGTAVGTYYGGPVGGAIGGVTGSFLGKAIGGGIGSLFGNGGPTSQQSQALADEQAQRDRLMAIASGNGPSVAGLQLGQGLQQIQRQVGSEAAGTTGPGGVLARYGAMQAGANADAATNQAAAIARAQEIANANQQLSGLASSTLGTTTGAQSAANALALQQQGQDLGELNTIGSALNKDYAAKAKGQAQQNAFNASTAPSGSGGASSTLGSGLSAGGGSVVDPDDLTSLG